MSHDPNDVHVREMPLPPQPPPEFDCDHDGIRSEAQAEIAAMLEDRASAFRGTETGRVLLGLAETIRQIRRVRS